MATFIELNSHDKGCPILVNLDHIVEIAPLVDGGCVLFMTDSAGMNSRQGIRVTDDYNQFKQFALQTVTSEDIEKKIAKLGGKKKESTTEVEIPKL